MRKHLHFFVKLLFALVIIGWSSVSFAQKTPPVKYSGGDGTSWGSAYLISTIDDLQYLSLNGEADGDWAAGVYFKQTTDIDASGISGLAYPEGFSPIGEEPDILDPSKTAFAGSYDGQGFKVTGLFINRPALSSVGLFGFMDATCIVKNLGVTGVNITGGNNVGSIGGMVFEALNCYSSGNVTGASFVGGFAGMVGLATKCYSTCTVNATGDYVGGFAGSDGAGTVTNCYATGSVTGANSVGGFYGVNYSNVINCYSIGHVTGTSNVGGFTGEGGGGVTASFWNTETSGQASSAGYVPASPGPPWVSTSGEQPKTTSEMKQVGTYLSDSAGAWDFTAAGNVWGFCGGQAKKKFGASEYPFLRYELQTPKNIWLGGTSTDWTDASNWSDNAVPAAGDFVFVPNELTNDPSISANVELGGLKIESGGTLTLESTGTLKVTGTFTNINGANGLILNNNASLLHSTAGVQGTVTRYIAKNAHWHLLSCPVAQATMPLICDGNFAPLQANFDATTGATYDFFSWDETLAVGDIWINLKKADWSPNTAAFGAPPRFESGKGYLVQYGPAFAGSWDKTFSGTLGVGNISIPVTSGGNTYNLIGNPYPSSIDWNAAAGWGRGNLATISSGKEYWVWNDATGQYGAYNTVLGEIGGPNGVSQYIAPEQGFFVHATSDGNVTMTDEVRVHSNQAWLKNNEGVLRLKVTSSINSYSDEIVLGLNYPEDAGTEKILSMYTDAPSLSLPLGNQNCCIRFISDPSANPAIPVNFKAGVDGDYTFTFTGIENLANIYLQDLKTGAVQNLKTQPTYTFTGLTAEDAGRFMLKFSALGIENAKAGDNGIYVYNNILNIVSPGISVVSIYSMVGAKVKEAHTNGETGYQLPLDLPTGYYVVNITDGKTVLSEKVFVK